MIPNILVSISGLPKSGKTHLAMTFPEPIKVFSFDGGAEYVKSKRFPDKAIDIVNFSMPIIESDETAEWAPPIWEDFYNQYKKAVVSKEYNTLVIDTASTLHTILNQAVFEWVRQTAEGKGKAKQKLAVNEYHTRNLLMKALFDLAKNAGINLVTTQYLSEKWSTPLGAKMAQPTGELKVQGWGQTEAFADINLEMEAQNRGGKVVMVATITSTRFERDTIGKKFDDTSYDELIALMFGE